MEIKHTHSYTHSLVATEDFLQDWNIALIVIGVVAFVIGDAIAAGLGVSLALRSVNLKGETYSSTAMYDSTLYPNGANTVISVFPV